MTTASRVRQTLSRLIGIQASLQTFALQTSDPRAKQAYEQGAEQAQMIITQLKERMNQMSAEEPQYE